MRMLTVGRAIGHAALTVTRAPWLVAGVALVTLVAAIPFGLALGTQLNTALADQPPISRIAGDIDPEWWLEFRQHAEGLAATFTPAIIGFAATLDNVSAVADGTRRPLVLAFPVAGYALLWAFLWGGLLHRFAAPRRLTLSAFWQACVRFVPRFAAISLVAAAVTLLLYLTVHQVLFGYLYPSVAANLSHERDAFLLRLALYAVFGVLLAGVAAVADYARVNLVIGHARTVADAITTAADFVRRQWLAVSLLYAIVGVTTVALLVAYGVVDSFGGVRTGGWRAIAIGQAVIIARLAIRLVTAAAEVRLVQQTSALQASSTAAE